MRFRYFDHTADAMFEGYGSNLEEAFENSALAMFNLITDITKVKADKKVVIKVKADTLEKLLFDFFDELLFHLDTEHLLFSGFKNTLIRKNGSYELTTTACGDHASHYERHGDIKAPTYNEMLITQMPGKVIIRAVVDI
jgi:SHS2 domain-containing protein